MRICPSCRYENEDSSMFCQKCGTRLTTQPSEEKMKQESPVTPAAENTVPVPKPVEKKKFPVFPVVAAAELLVFILIVIGICALLFMRTRPSFVAEKYFSAYADQDWKTVYSLMDIPDGDFTGVDMFEETMGRKEYPEINHYKIHTLDGYSPDSGMMKYMEAEYTVDGQGTGYMQIPLIRQDEKSLFIFDKWKVSSQELLINAYQISVPTGSSASVDGIELTDDYIISSGENGMDIYEISLFNGVHTVNVAAPWCENYEGEFDTDIEGSLMVSDMTLTDEGKAALEAKMQQILERFYTSAMSGAAYSELEDLFADGAAERFEEDYNDLKNRFVNDPDDYFQYDVKQITFNNFTSSFYYDYGLLGGELDGDYTVDYSYTYTGYFGTNTNDDTNKGSLYMWASFVYEDDTYKISDISIPTVWW